MRRAWFQAEGGPRFTLSVYGDREGGMRYLLRSMGHTLADGVCYLEPGTTSRNATLLKVLHHAISTLPADQPHMRELWAEANRRFA